MKGVLFWFLSAFFVLFVTGYINGCKEACRDDFVDREIVAHFKVGLSTNFKRSIVYEANGEDLYVYEIDSKKLYITPAKLALDKQRRDGMGDPADDKTITTVLGGATGGVTVWKLGGGKKKKEVVAAILGAVVGYGLGYSFGKGNGVEPDSRLVIKTLDDEKNWIRLKRIFLETIYTQTREMAQVSKDEKLVDEVDERISKIDPDLIDSKTISEAVKVHDTALNSVNEKFENLFEDKEPKSWFWKNLPFIVVATLFGGVALFAIAISIFEAIEDRKISNGDNPSKDLANATGDENKELKDSNSDEQIHEKETTTPRTKKKQSKKSKKKRKRN